MRGKGLSPQAERQLRDLFRKLQRLHPGLIPQRERQDTIDQYRQAILIEDLDAATDTLTDPGTAQAKLLTKGSDGDLYVDKDAAGNDIEVEVVNRFTGFSLSTDTYLHIKDIDGEWQPVAADCD